MIDRAHLGPARMEWPADWDHCYEDMGDDPCGKPPVAARPDPEEGGLYPVCAEHAVRATGPARDEGLRADVDGYCTCDGPDPRLAASRDGEAG